jgi:hypothetical protein
MQSTINVEAWDSCICSNCTEKLKVSLNGKFTELHPPPKSINDLHDNKIDQGIMYTLFRPDVLRV